MRPRDSSRPARLRDQRGLTAIELMVTLAILAILIGIAAPSMTRFIVQWRLSNAVNAVTGSLRTARTEAIARARPVVVCQLRAGTAVECETARAATISRPAGSSSPRTTATATSPIPSRQTKCCCDRTHCLPSRRLPWEKPAALSSCPMVW
ncbi:Tfp pilus assembly protein FimT/FimU [Variovorax sp. V512]|uniref:pilus assembly FimT family protein n=1 Tax=Variovorax sp. V512 TaxID=3064160 RepID=UPI0034E88227